MSRLESEYHVILSTCPDRETAERIALALVERRLAACANILPGLHSVYRWQGAVERSEEHLLLIKSRASAYTEVEDTLRALHPYEVPEVIALPVTAGLPAYLAWIKESMEGEA